MAKGKKNPLNHELRTHDDIQAHYARLQRKIRHGKLTDEEGKIDRAKVLKIELEMKLLESARKGLDSSKRYGDKSLKNPADLGTPKPVKRPSEGPWAPRVVEGGKE